MEDAAGELAHHLLVLIGPLQGGGEEFGLDVPAVDEEVLIRPVSPAAGGEGDVASDRHLLPLPLDGGVSQGHVPAQDGIQGGGQLPVPGGHELLLSVPEKLQGHLRVGEGQLLHQGKHRRPFCGVPLHKLQPGGGVVEEVPHHQGGAQGAAGGLLGEDLPPFDGQGGAQLGPRRAGE